MKLSSGIFLVGISVIIVEIMIAANLEEPGNVLKGLTSEDVFDKMSTLYFFIIIILFFFGGINFYLEKRMQGAKKILFSEAEFDLEKNDLDEEYIENITRNAKLSQFAPKPTDGSEVLNAYGSAQDFGGQGFPTQKQKSDDDPLTILKKRLVKGEITKKEYKDLKSVLE